MKYISLWRSFGWLMVLVVIFVTLDPHPPDLSKMHLGDKVAHTGSYLILMYWLGQCYHSRRHLSLAAILVALGVGLEFMQGWSGYRTFDYYDMAANSFGVILGWGLLFTPLGNLIYFIDTRIS